MSGVRSYNFISSILERLRTHHTQNLFDTRSASDARQRLDIMRGKSSPMIVQNRVPRSPKSTFFQFSRKKIVKHLVGSEKGRTFALAFQNGGIKTRSLTDCEQNTRQAARRHII